MIAGTGAEHHRFAPVLALFELVKTAVKRRRGLGTMSPSRFGRQPNIFPRFANLPYIKKISPDKMPRLIRMVEKIKL